MQAVALCEEHVMSYGDIEEGNTSTRRRLGSQAWISGAGGAGAEAGDGVGFFKDLYSVFNDRFRIRNGCESARPSSRPNSVTMLYLRIILNLRANI